MRRSIVIAAVCLACAALGVGAGWLVWGKSNSDGVYAGLSQDEIEKSVLTAVQGHVEVNGSRNRAVDARCKQRRFEDNVFDCQIEWEHVDQYHLDEAWTARFIGPNVAHVEEVSLSG